MSYVSPKVSRRNSAALKNVIVRRSSLNAVVNLNALVRVFFLDGSSKVLQLFENSTIADVLVALKFNLDLSDISTHALFRVFGSSIRRVELNEVVADVLRDPTDSGQEVRLLFRSWITYKYGTFDSEVFQYGHRVKQPNTALWLTFMEATFMINTEKFFLTEDESLILGCLKLQAEAGDFNPAIHNLEVLKNRVIARFPNPIRNRMKALCSATVSGMGLGNDLALRVQLFYARMAGKSKVDAQIDFLSSLRSFCPFYGSTFFEVHCQYDDNPLEQDNSPPIISMSACVGPLAIILMTQTEQPIIMRHPYKRIIKWVTYPEKHIFTYWVIKPNVSLYDLEEYQEEAQGELDTRRFCDCVYLVTSQAKELEYLVKSYVEAARNDPPHLPDAKGDLLPPTAPSSATPVTTVSEIEHVAVEEQEQYKEKQAQKPKNTRLSIFFNALGISGSDSSTLTGSGIGENKGDEIYGDDTAGVSKSMFQGVYKSLGRSPDAREGDNDSDDSIPPAIQYAANMTELKKLAEEQNFSDSEEEGDDGDDDDDDEGSHEDSENSHSESSEKGDPRRKGGSTLKAIKRASAIFFK